MNPKVSRTNFDSLEKLELSSKECVYVVDVVQYKITYHKGVYNMLGFDEQETTITQFLKGYHTDDFEIVNRISKNVISYYQNNSGKDDDNALYMTYRRKRRNGSFLTVLSKTSIYEVYNETIRSVLIKLTDISFVKMLQHVSWSFEAKEPDNEVFKSKIYEYFEGIFTEREIDVIRLIKDGLTNKLIGEKLCISEHTVTSHRKSIFKKSDSHNAGQLISFCMERGIG